LGSVQGAVEEEGQTHGNIKIEEDQIDRGDLAKEEGIGLERQGGYHRADQGQRNR
jgi:hypothetical protein